MPATARHELGVDLRLVQSGERPRDWKPITGVGAGVIEIRARTDDGAFRVLYVAKFSEGIYVLHAFQKKSRKTAQFDLELARSRYAAVVRSRVRR
ncbi:MAG: type II toxin-antitoxin system RelE/ParE family toxin [Gemmatimonadaceae bacterium]